MAIRLDEARLRLLKIVDTSNTIKIYPNNITSYGGLVVEGYQNGGYDGIHLGSNVNYMTVMSSDTHQGLYNQSKGRWIIYFNRSSDSIGLGTDSLVANNIVTITGNAVIKNLLTVANGVHHYGIKVGDTYINAIDGDVIFQNNNALRFGSDNWNWDEWAGLKYDWVNKYIYLGIADKNIFTGNSVMSGGRILTPGISHFHVGNQTTYYMTDTGTINANTVYAHNWFRSSGATGWYSSDYDGGWYMSDATYVRSYNNKSLWVGNNIHIGTSTGNGTGLALYSTSSPTVYGIHMSTTTNFGKHGDVQSDWATYFNMNAVGQRGWIYRGGSTNVASISANGIGTFKGVMGETGHILSPDGGRYTTTTETHTGYLKITLPVSWTNAMMRFVVDIYDYTTDNTVTYIIGGYNYSNNSQWYNTTAQCISKWGTGKSNLDVRFGHDGSKCAIYIGSVDTAWKYPQVVVRDVLIGYGQASSIVNYSKGWSIGFTTTLGTITSTKNDTNVGYSVNYANSAGSATQDSSGNTISSTYLKLAGGTMSANAAIKFPATAGSIAVSDPMSITYGRIAAYGTLCLNADTDGTTTEYLILTAGRGHSNSTGDGLAVGYSTLTWLGNSVLTTAGGTLNNSASLKRRYTSTSWVQGRAGAVLVNSYDANNRFTANAYNPLWSVKSINGSWDCGTYTANNNLYFTYITDANFDADNNTTTQQIYISGTTGRIHANLEGTAKYLGRGGDPALSMVFNWSGQSGQPSWLWGGNDGTNMYVYNPSNFNVNYANSAGSVAWGNITGKPSSYTPASHTHNYAGASSAGGAANSANVLNINNTAALSNCLQYIQTSSQTAGNDLPSATWWHVIKMSHGNGDTYYKRLLAFNFWSHDISTSYAAGDGAVAAWKKVWVEGNSITGAVWNDYAEYRESDCEEFGRVLFEKGDDSLSMTTQRLQSFAGVSSDTWGFCQGETEKAKTPIAVAGRVLVYTYQDRNNYKPGDCVCAAPGGTVDIMTREEIIQYPDRIVGTVSCVPEYNTWGSGDRDPVDVDGRIWIKV